MRLGSDRPSRTYVVETQPARPQPIDDMRVEQAGRWQLAQIGDIADCHSGVGGYGRR
jgi:hypothetical protein